MSSKTTRFLSSLYVDGHTLCTKCRGKDCDPSNTCPECQEWTDNQWMVYSSRRSFQKRKSSESSSLSEISSRSSSSGKKMAAREEEALPGQRTGQTPGTGQMSSFKPVPSTVTVQTAGPGSVLEQKPAYSQKPSQPSLTGQMQPRTSVPGHMTVQTLGAGFLSPSLPVVCRVTRPGPARCLVRGSCLVLDQPSTARCHHRGLCPVP